MLHAALHWDDGRVYQATSGGLLVPTHKIWGHLSLNSIHAGLSDQASPTHRHTLNSDMHFQKKLFCKAFHSGLLTYFVSHIASTQFWWKLSGDFPACQFKFTTLQQTFPRPGQLQSYLLNLSLGIVVPDLFLAWVFCFSLRNSDHSLYFLFLCFSDFT